MEPTQGSVEDIFQRHNHLLEQHRHFLEQIKRQHGSEGRAGEVVSLSVAQTESMSQSFAECRAVYATTYTSTSKAPQDVPMTSDPPVVIPPSAPVIQQPYQRVDPSGLFMFDTVPTPPNEYLRRLHEGTPRSSRPPPKRKDLSGPDGQEHDNTPRKKARLSDGNVSTTGSAHRSNPQPSMPAPDTREDLDGGEDDSFIREVEELRKTKEEKRKKLEQKKRKRESGGSDGHGPLSGKLGQMSLNGGSEPKRKRQKTDKHNSSPGNSTTKPKGTPKKSRHRSKNNAGGSRTHKPNNKAKQRRG